MPKPGLRPWLAYSLAVCGAGLLVFAALWIVDRPSASSRASVPAPATATVTVTRTVPTVATTTITTTTTTTAPADAVNGTSGDTASKTTIPQGQWLVGTEVAPGTYRSPGGATSAGVCYWFRKSADGSRTIDSNGTQGPARVTIKSGELFENGTCQPFTKVD